jgi:hypothetical protein
MQVLLVQTFLAFVVVPVMVFMCMRVIVKFSLALGPKYWWAIAAGIYAVFAIFFGLSLGADAGAELGALLGLSERYSWLSAVVAGAMALALYFWIIIVQHARLQAMLPPPEPGR